MSLFWRKCERCVDKTDVGIALPVAHINHTARASGWIRILMSGMWYNEGETLYSGPIQTVASRINEVYFHTKSGLRPFLSLLPGSNVLFSQKS